MPPLTVALLRVGLAAVILNVVTRAMDLRLPADGRIWIAFGGAGLLNNAVPFSLMAWGQSHIAGGLAAVLNATAPLWTVVVAHFLTADEKMTGSRLCGVLIGFLGVVVMRIASSEMLPDVELLPHLKCSRPGWGRRGSDEAGEHGDA